MKQDSMLERMKNGLDVVLTAKEIPQLIGELIAARYEASNEVFNLQSQISDLQQKLSNAKRQEKDYQLRLNSWLGVNVEAPTV